MNLKADGLPSMARRSARAGVFSADAVLSYFHERGVGREAITGDHLLPLYAGLNLIEQAPLEDCLQAPPLEGTGEIGQGPVCAVMLETRPHKALEAVVSTFQSQLKIPVHLFHGLENEAFIRESSIAELVERGSVQLHRMNVSKLAARPYNAILMNRGFWERLAGYEKVLVFQTDALLCPASPYSLSDFLSFDYIGSTWTSGRPVQLRVRGGSGGLSLRDSAAHLQCTERFPPQHWPGGEDAYFAFHLDLMGRRVATEEDSARFSTQQRFEEWSFGVHKPSLLGKELLKKFLEYCPEARLIL